MEIRKVLGGAIRVLEILCTLMVYMAVSVHGGRCDNVEMHMSECTSGVQSKYYELKPRVDEGNYSGVQQLCRMQTQMNTCLHDELQPCGILGRQYLYSVRQRMKDVRKLCRDFKKMKKRKKITTTPDYYYNDYQNEPTVPYVVDRPSTTSSVARWGQASTQASKNGSSRQTRTSVATIGLCLVTIVLSAWKL